ncbi:protein LTV1-like protein [Cucumis melo var. makuwa]|uniref:Protein LTV1-like protein n=1 Tax=Cucumis melo var. makuwa TaxID=1194695 RepID=A0A5A7TR06_CUCMM|nr:protein LTV1-like protein [Cucumis melo var. makuwa]
MDAAVELGLASSNSGGIDCDEPCIAKEDESLAQKLNHALSNHSKDDLELEQGCKAPANILSDNGIKDEFVFEENSVESEVWDCETIASICSNLNNHPRKNMASEMTRRKKLAKTVTRALSSINHVITLQGKEKLPMNFLPHGRKVDSEIY